MVKELSKIEMEQLRKTVRKFLEDQMKKKLRFSFHWRELLDYSGQVSLTLNDHDARLMKIKDKNQKISKIFI